MKFLNQPKPLNENDSEHDKHKYERSMALIPHIESFLVSNDRFKNKEVSVTFSHSGVSSLVCMLDCEGEKTILKIPIVSVISEGEVDCLKQWEAVGVSVPGILDEGTIGERPYILMSFINARRLSEVPTEEIDKNLFLKLGQILNQMHQTKAQGYGRICNHRAQYENFRDWIWSEEIQKRLDYIKDQKIIIDEKHGSITKALELLTVYVENNPQSTYCHQDFGTGNAFDTDPITIFDPNPLINHPIIDISRSIVLMAASGKKSMNSIDQMMKGYFGEEEIDRKAFQAAIIFNTYSKLFNWYRSKKMERVENILGYLEKTKNLLYE